MVILQISTHTPLAGRDAGSIVAYLELDTFLLTRPLRDVTQITLTDNVFSPISTHTPLAGRDEDQKLYENDGYISTHTPLAGRDRYI